MVLLQKTFRGPRHWKNLDDIDGNCKRRIMEIERNVARDTAGLRTNARAGEIVRRAPLSWKPRGWCCATTGFVPASRTFSY